MTEVIHAMSSPSGSVVPAELCSVFVPSCDSYSDLWRPFFSLFWKHWPDCPFPVYLGSNAQKFEDARVKSLLSSEGNNWTNRLRGQLQLIPTPYVLMVLEDFFFDAPVDTAGVLESLQVLCSRRGKMIRLLPKPAPDRPLEGFPAVGTIEPGSPYRICTQAAIWDKSALLNLMREGESIWQFEHLGTARAETIQDGFYGVWSPLIDYGHHVVERGKWFRDSARKYGRMGIGCDFVRRGIMSRYDSIRRNVAGAMVLSILHWIPWRLRNKIFPYVRRAAAAAPLLSAQSL